MVKIVITAIVLAVLVGLFVIYRKQIFGAFGEAGDGISDFFGRGAQGVQDFFSGFGSSSSPSPDSGLNPDASQQSDAEQIELFDRTLTSDEELVINFNDNPDSLSDTEKAKAQEIINGQLDADPQLNDIDRFNPPGIIGYGYENFGDGRGLPDTPENRDLLEQFLASRETTPSFAPETIPDFDGLGDVIPNLNLVPEAFADDGVESDTLQADDVIPKSEIDSTNEVDPDILQRYPNFKAFSPRLQERILSNFESASNQIESDGVPASTRAAQREIDVTSQIDNQQFSGGGQSFQGGTVRTSNLDEATIRSRRQESEEIMQARRLAGESRDSAIAELDRTNSESRSKDAELMRRAEEANMQSQGQFFGKTPEEIVQIINGGDINKF